MFRKYDKGYLGLTGGMVLPMLAMIIFYFTLYSDLAFGSFLNRLFVSKLFFSVLSICVVPNLILFFVFIWTHRLMAARGVLGATFVYAFVVMAFRLFD